MTVAATLLTSGFGSGTTLTTSSITLTSGRQYLLCVLDESNPASSRPHATCTGWTEVRFSAGGPNRDILAITILRKEGDGSTGTHAVSFASSSTFADYHVIEITGAGTGNPVVQSNATISGSSGGPSTTLAAFADAVNNAAFAFACKWFVNLTAESGYSTISTNTGDVPVISEYKVGQDTTPSATCAGGDDSIIVAMEIAAAGGGGGTVGRLVGGTLAGGVLVNGLLSGGM